MFIIFLGQAVFSTFHAALHAFRPTPVELGAALVYIVPSINVLEEN